MNQPDIRIDDKTREETNRSTGSFIRYRSGTFSPFENGVRTFPWHWHSEAECFYIQQGSLTYHIPGREYVYRKGDIGFVNAGVLHMLSDTGEKTAKIQNHIFLPQMICGEDKSLEAKYVAPLLLNSAAPMMIIPAKTDDAVLIRKWMDEAHKAYLNEEFAYELTVRDCMSRIWAVFMKNMPVSSERKKSKESLRLMDMIRYIGEHYSEKITLKNLSVAAHISEKECERCFYRQIMMPPFEYIMEYRLEKARNMLWQNRERSITEIGQSCGFSTSSYFGKCFREKYKMSPNEYRKRGLLG